MDTTSAGAAYALAGLLVLVVSGIILIWKKRQFTPAQRGKIFDRVEVAVALLLGAVGAGVTFYYQFAK